MAPVSRCIWWSLQVVLVINIAILPVTNSLSEKDQAKVLVSLEGAEFTLTRLDAFLTKERKAYLFSGTSANPAAKLSNLQEIIEISQTVGVLLEVVPIIGMVAKFLFAFLPSGPSDLELVQKELRAVNGKLDDMSTQMDNMKDEIKSAVEINTWLTTYITWEFDIRNAEVKLQEMLRRMQTLTTAREKVKAAEEFVNFFENNNIESSLMNIHRLASQPPSSTNKNLFDLYTAEFSCDIRALSGLTSVLRYIMTSGIKQTLVYYAFKGRTETELSDIQNKYFNYVYDIRHYYDSSVWNCVKNSVGNSRETAQNIILSNSNLGSVDLTKTIQVRLEDLYPWYAWAVSEINPERFGKAGIHVGRVGIGDFPVFESRGDSYYLVREYGQKKRSLLVAWQDISDKARSCSDYSEARTLVYFKLCSGCSRETTAAPQAIPTSRVCTPRNKYYEWIAAGFRKQSDPCGKNTCGDHGFCKSIAGSSSPLCLCESYYEGDRCGEYFNLTASEEIREMIAQLRESTALLFGIPTVVDVYFEIRNIHQNFDNAIKELKTDQEYTRALIKHAEILYQSQYITDTYSSLLSGTISFDTFGKNMHHFLRSNPEDYIIHRLRGILLGNGIVDGEDFFTIYKRAAALKFPPCSRQYGTVTSSLLRNLAALDLGVNEALFRYNAWQILSGHMSQDKQEEVVKIASNRLVASKERLKSYQNVWKTRSCPELRAKETQQNHCKETLSFKGMQVTLKCSDSRKYLPSGNKVVCSEQRGSLRWSNARPVCSYKWASWGSWSDCSQTCGGGTRHRTRHRTNGQQRTDRQRCNTQECCQEKYRKFKCRNRKCISSSLKCNGRDDCGDNSDESTSVGCRYLRSGNRIALRSECNTWLSCYCTLNCGKKYCTTQTCPGTSMDGKDWSTCSGESFQIYNNRKDGEAIRYGDIVAVKYYRQWLSCWGKLKSTGPKCGVRNCPGSTMNSQDWSRCDGETFRIYAIGREGGCTGDNWSRCIGKPIHSGDMIFLRYKYDSKKSRSYYLSDLGRTKDIRTRTCPGRYVSRSDINSCKCEAWKLTVKP